MAGLYSCQSPNGGRGDFLYHINLDEAETVDSPFLSDFCDKAQTIILENSDSSLLGEIYKLFHTNDRLYIFDFNVITGGTVSEFDMGGQFIKRYGRVGRGPGEYIRLYDFTVDEQNRIMYLLDFQTGRIISYNLNSGQYIETVRIDQNGTSSTTIIPIGGLIYSDLIYRAFDESNYMLKSWSKDDPAIENYYLPIGKHLEGWSDVSLVGISKFIYQDANDYALFSNQYSPEIYKLTTNGIGNYIYINSKNFIDKQGRQIASGAWSSNSPGAASATHQTIGGIDQFREVRDYFETDKYICFKIKRGNPLRMFLYDKRNGATQTTNSFYNDLIVKKENPEARGVAMPFYADREGVFYYTRTQMIPRLRTAAQEGMLVEGLDRLEELKQLPDDSNPVIFYMKFKEPMQ